MPVGKKLCSDLLAIIPKALISRRYIVVVLSPTYSMDKPTMIVFALVYHYSVAGFIGVIDIVSFDNCAVGPPIDILNMLIHILVSIA